MVVAASYCTESKACFRAGAEPGGGGRGGQCFGQTRWLSERWVGVRVVGWGLR